MAHMQDKENRKSDENSGSITRSKSKRLRSPNKQSISTSTRKKKGKPDALKGEAHTSFSTHVTTTTTSDIGSWPNAMESYLTFHPDEEWMYYSYPSGYYARSLRMVKYAESIAQTLLPLLVHPEIARLPKEIGGIVVEYFRFTIADVLHWTIQSCRKLVGKDVALNARIFPKCENDSDVSLRRQANIRRQAHWTLYWCLVRSFLPDCIPMKSLGPFIPEYDASSGGGIPYKDIRHFPQLFRAPPGPRNPSCVTGRRNPTFLTLVGSDEHALLSHPSIRNGTPGVFSEVLCELTKDLDIIGPCLNTSKVTSKMIEELAGVDVNETQEERAWRQEKLLYQIEELAELRVIIEIDFPKARRAWNTFQKLYQFGDPLPILDDAESHRLSPS